MRPWRRRQTAAADDDYNPMKSAVANATASSSSSSPLTIATAVSTASSTDELTTIALVCVITLGIFCNLSALFVLRRYRKHSKDKKRIGFISGCLAAQECITLVWKLVATLVQIGWPSSAKNVWMCRCHVLFRFFVWGSGCSSLVMAIDRWLSVTRPFFYKHGNSFCRVKRIMAILLLEVLCLVCAPLFGFGVYWDDKNMECVDSNYSKKFWDMVYNYLKVVHGVILCFAIMYLNIAVSNALRKGESNFNNPDKLTRHVSQGSTVLVRERSLARFMLITCVGIMICLIPKLLPIMLIKFIKNKTSFLQFNEAADMLLYMHFVIDPCMTIRRHWNLENSSAHGQYYVRTPRTAVSVITVQRSTQWHPKVSHEHAQL